MTAKVAVVYCSATGTVHALAEAVAGGAASVGAEVRLRRAAELAPDNAIDENPQWRRHADATAGIAEATIEDLAWADALAFGTPSRFGAPAAQLKQLIDQAGGLWRERGLADKPVMRSRARGARLLSLASTAVRAVRRTVAVSPRAPDQRCAETSRRSPVLSGRPH